MTPKQLKFVTSLLNREGILFAAETIAVEFSNNRTNELAALTYTETQNLINAYRNKTPADKMRGKILSMAHEMRWETPKGKVDIDKLNAWCVKSTPSHTDFNGISLKDLPIVVSIFEKMYKSFLKQL